MIANAVFPGTFDPITSGHIDVICRASKIFNHLIIAVAKDTGKNCFFSQDERLDLVRYEIKRVNIQNVEVVPFSGLLVDFLKKNNVKTIIRGIRNLIDLETEMSMFSVNKKLYQDIDTIFFPSSDLTRFVSSTLIKHLLMIGSDVSEFISDNVKNKFLNKINIKN